MTRNRIDPELGPERYCPGCDEWWPLDTDFWLLYPYHAGDVAKAKGRIYRRRTSGTAATCRACHSDRNRRGHLRRRARRLEVRAA